MTVHEQLSLKNLTVMRRISAIRWGICCLAASLKVGLLFVFRVQRGAMLGNGSVCFKRAPQEGMHGSSPPFFSFSDIG
jgi:hypothetical protein